MVVAILSGKPAAPAATMAVLCSIGGSIGYARTRSLPSLVAGVSVGLLYAFSGFRIHHSAAYGIETATVASIVLLASSAPRFTKGPLPKTLTITSVLSGSFYVKQLLD